MTWLNEMIMIPGCTLQPTTAVINDQKQYIPVCPDKDADGNDNPLKTSGDSSGRCMQVSFIRDNDHEPVMDEKGMSVFVCCKLFPFLAYNSSYSSVFNRCDFQVRITCPRLSRVPSVLMGATQLAVG